MKSIKVISFILVVSILMSFCMVSYAAFETQLNDTQAICDIAVEYVNSESKEDFKQYMSDAISEEVFFESGKFEFLFNEDKELKDDKNQLTKMISVIGDIYVNGGTAKLTDSDINENVSPGYSDGTEMGNDFEEDDAEAFMEVINENKEKLTVKPKKAEVKTEKKTEAKKETIPEKNTASKETEETESKSSGTSVGIVILIAFIISIIVFVAGTYALQQVNAKNKEQAAANLDSDDIFNMRLAVKSMQTSIEKADGNFKELDKLRIQVDEMDQKLEHISEYLRKLNKGE